MLPLALGSHWDAPWAPKCPQGGPRGAQGGPGGPGPPQAPYSPYLPFEGRGQYLNKPMQWLVDMAQSAALSTSVLLIQDGDLER